MDINSLVDFYNSPAQLKEFLDSRNMAMQKKFGQNFMINGDARKKIAEQRELTDYFVINNCFISTMGIDIAS